MAHGIDHFAHGCSQIGNLQAYFDAGGVETGELDGVVDESL